MCVTYLLITCNYITVFVFEIYINLTEILDLWIVEWNNVDLLLENICMKRMTTWYLLNWNKLILLVNTYLSSNNLSYDNNNHDDMSVLNLTYNTRNKSILESIHLHMIIDINQIWNYFKWQWCYQWWFKYQNRNWFK